MRKTFRLATVATCACVAGAMAASAAIIDFTDNSIYTSRSGSSATGTIDGIGFTVTGSLPRLTFAANGPGPIGGLAGENDGIGLGDDEIGGTEFLTVTFDREVSLLAASFLDFFSASSGDAEEALVFTGTTPAAGNLVTTFLATQAIGGGRPGFGTFALLTSGTAFTFATSAHNDGIGVGDYALAALEVEERLMPPLPVPLPAAAGLLVTGLFLFRPLRRRLI